MSETNTENSVEISTKVKNFVFDNSLSVPEAQELTDIFEKNKQKTIVISQETLKKLRKAIGSNKDTSYITDSEKKLIKDKTNTPEPSLPKKAELLKIDAGLGGSQVGGTEITFKKAPGTVEAFRYRQQTNLKWGQTIIGTNTSTGFSNRLGGAKELTVGEVVVGVQKNGSGKKNISPILGGVGSTKVSTDMGTFGVHAGMVKAETTGSMFGGTYKSIDKDLYMEINKTVNYLDPTTHLYTSGTNISAGGRVGDLGLGTTLFNGRVNYDINIPPEFSI